MKSLRSSRQMISRLLTFANAAGCVILIALVVIQWGKERGLNGDLAETRSELADVSARKLEQEQRLGALERDIQVLKDSLTATQQAAETTARELGEKTTAATALETELQAAREQIVAWETALKARDERIRGLTDELAATRKRLDEAVARLKAAAER